MTTQLPRRTARRLTRLNTPWFGLARRHTTPAGRPDLAAELATYRTPAELADLHAMLQQYPDEETAEIRAILEGQAERRQFNQPTSRRAV